MSFGGFFRKIAPWLSAGAEFIPGAGPVIAGTVNSIAQATGHTNVQAEGTLDSISEAVASMSGNADALQKLKAADQAYQLQLQAAGFKQVTDLQKLQDDDRANARAMQVATKSWIPATLAMVITVGFLGLLFGMAIGKLKVVDNQAFILLLGSLATSWGMVVAYYFGSSSGSADKTSILAAQAQNGQKK